MDDIPVCERHTLADVMPHSGRCRACIEESNAEAKPYLEAAHTFAQDYRKVLKYVRSVQQESQSSIDAV